MKIKEGDCIYMNGYYSFDPIIGKILWIKPKNKDGFIFVDIKVLKYLGRSHTPETNKHVFGHKGNRSIWIYSTTEMREIRKIPEKDIQSEYQILKLTE